MYIKCLGGGSVYNKYGFNSAEDVKEFLKIKGLKVDGVIGEKTIKALQKDLGVKANGIWGKQSAAALAARLNGNVTNTSTSNTGTKQSGTIIIPGYEKKTKVKPEVKIEPPVVEEPSLWERGEKWVTGLFSDDDGSWGGGRSGGGGAGGRYGKPEPEVTIEKKPNLIMHVEETKKSFNEAFAEARRKGLKTFIFNGKTYGTKLATDKEQGRRAQEARAKRFETRVDGFILPF